MVDDIANVGESHSGVCTKQMLIVLKDLWDFHCAFKLKVINYTKVLKLVVKRVILMLFFLRKFGELQEDCVYLW